MKILFLNLYQNQNRGVETFLTDITKELGKQHQVKILSGKPTVFPVSNFPKNIFKRIQKRVFLDKPNLQVLVFSLSQIKFIIKQKPQIIVTTNGFWQVVVIKFLQLFLNFKIVITGHSGFGWDEKLNLWLCPDLFIATTPQMAVWAKKVSPKTQITTIPLGIDFKKFKAKPIKLNLKEPIILCPAALVPYKQIDLTIKAVSNLKSGSLLVLGRGPQKDQLQALANQLLPPSRFSIKTVSYREIPKYFQAASIVTLVSKSQEAFGRVLIEALASEKIVVTANSEKNRWILGQNAIYTDPQNTDSYSKALTKALNKKFSKTKTINRYKIDQVAKKYLAEFEKLTNK